MTSSTIFFFFIPFLALVLLGINLIFAPHNPYQEKKSVFECGYHSFLGQNRTQFSISFFIFALLFLLFDLEILLIYPYIVSSYTITIYGLVIMLIFFLVLTLGFQFELGKKALNIYSRQLNIIKYIYILRVSLQSNLFFVTSCITFMSTITTAIVKLVNLNLLLNYIIIPFVSFTIICTFIWFVYLIIHHADNNEETSNAASQDVNHGYANMYWKFAVRNRCPHQWIVYPHPIPCNYASSPNDNQCSQLRDINWICKDCYEIRCGTHAASHWRGNCGSGVYRSPSPPKESSILSLLYFISLIEVLVVTILVLLTVAFVTVTGRKTMASMQKIFGTKIRGYYDLLLSFTDAFKFFLKKCISPTRDNIILFFIGSVIALDFSLLGYTVIAYGPGLSILDSNLGILYVLAVSLFTYGILLAGWSANTKYAFFGSLVKYFYTLKIQVSKNMLILKSSIITFTFNKYELLKTVCIMLFFLVNTIIPADTIYAAVVGDGFTANDDGTYSIDNPDNQRFVSNAEHLIPPYTSNHPFATNLVNAMEYDDNCHRESKGWAINTRPRPLNSSKYGTDAQQFLDNYLQYKEPRGPNFIYKNTGVLRDALRRLP